MIDKRIFKATEIDSYASGWIVDLSPADCVNPDYYWFWRTKAQAKHFLDLVDGDMPAYHAAYWTNQWSNQ